MAKKTVAKKNNAALPEKPSADVLGKHIGCVYSGLGGAVLASGFAIQNPDLLVADYGKMLAEDDAVSPGLEFLAYSVVSRLGEYRHENDEITQYVKLCLERIHGTLHRAIRDALSYSIAFGYSVTEFTLTQEDGRWLLSSLSPYWPEGCKFKVGKKEDNSIDVLSIEQNTDGTTVDIPRYKAIVLRHGSSISPYGKSRLKLCHRWWRIKEHAARWFAIALEKYTLPLLLGKTESPDEMEEALENLAAKSSLVVSPADSVETLDRGAGTAAFEAAIAFLNRSIYRSMFLPPLLIEGEAGGSYSLGRVHYGIFSDACTWMAAELAEELVEQLWRPLIVWNFGEQNSYGVIPLVDNRTPDERSAMASVFASAISSGVLFPEEDGEWMREQLGFPKASGETGPGFRVNLLPSRLGRESKGKEEGGVELDGKLEPTGTPHKKTDGGGDAGKTSEPRDARGTDNPAPGPEGLPA